MNFKKNNMKSYKCDDGEESDSEIETEFNIKTKGNEIYYYEDIEKEKILELINQIKDLTYDLQIKSIQYDFEPHIKLHIYSDGGDAFMGLSIYEFIKKNKVPIYTYINGYIASAATFMFLAGKKRYMSKNSSVLIHQVSTSFWGKFEDLKDECQNTTNLMDIVRNLYNENTIIKKKELKKLLQRELFLTFEDCRKIGFFTEER